MEDISIRGVREDSRTEFISSLKMLTVNSRFTNMSNISDTTDSFPHMYYSFHMNDLHIYNSKEELLLLKALTLEAKVNTCVFNFYYHFIFTYF